MKAYPWKIMEYLQENATAERAIRRSDQFLNLDGKVHGNIAVMRFLRGPWMTPSRTNCFFGSFVLA